MASAGAVLNLNLHILTYLLLPSYLATSCLSPKYGEINIHFREEGLVDAGNILILAVLTPPPLKRVISMQCVLHFYFVHILNTTIH